jgi:hypothetical protein
MIVRLENADDVASALEDAQNRSLEIPDTITEDDVEMILQKINPTNIKNAVKRRDHLAFDAVLIDPKASTQI